MRVIISDITSKKAISLIEACGEYGLEKQSDKTARAKDSITLYRCECSPWWVEKKCDYFLDS